jgi:hypothetical protein
VASGITGLVGVIAAELIVVVHFDSGLGQEGLEGFEVFVTKSRTAVEKQNLDGCVA